VGAPHLFFGGILAITVPSVLLIWFLFHWGYRRQIDGLKDQFAGQKEQFAAMGQRLALAQDSAQVAEQTSKDLRSVIEKLEAQLKTKASSEDIAVTISSAKTKAGELVSASNAVSSAIAIAARVSAGSSMRVQLEAIKDDKDG
jgi:cell division septum initiation protein DivIVA